jgi:hypothetical protein
VDYAIYSQNGTLDLGGTTVIGPVGNQIPSVTLPPAPAAAVGTTPILITNNKAVSVDPGAYAAVVVGNNCTLNFRAGEYSFASFLNPESNGVRLNFDASAGDVTLVIAGGFVVKNDLTVTKTGPGRVRLYVLSGGFSAVNSGGFELDQLFVYSGDLSFGNATDVRAQLFANDDVIIGNGQVSLPADAGAGAAVGILVTSIWDAGAWGPVSTLCPGMPGASGLEPFAVSPPLMRRVQVLSWQEVSP